MAYSSLDPTTGAPVFLDGDAPDPAVNPSQVAAYAAQVGTRLVGSTAERTAYEYAREGLQWWDTTDDTLYQHDGTDWAPIWHDFKTYTPTTAGVSGGTLAARYMRVGHMISVEIRLSFSGANLTAQPTFTLPVTAAMAPQFQAGTVTLYDANGSEYPGVVRVNSTTVAGAYSQAVVSDEVIYGAVNATTPFTWASGDVLHMEFSYRAA
jgi:hypothetical protein